VSKSTGEFHQAKWSVDGHRPECKECRREEGKRRYAEKREHILTKAAEWRAANPERVRTHARRKNQHLRTSVIEGYGGACACCGEDEPKFLSIDHICGGGTQERKTVPSTTLYRRLIKEGFPRDRYQLLCHNCNMAKGFYGACPHQLKAA